MGGGGKGRRGDGILGWTVYKRETTSLDKKETKGKVEKVVESTYLLGLQGGDAQKQAG